MNKEVHSNYLIKPLLSKDENLKSRVRQVKDPKTHSYSLHACFWQKIKTPAGVVYQPHKGRPPSVCEPLLISMASGELRAGSRCSQLALFSHRPEQYMASTLSALAKKRLGKRRTESLHVLPPVIIFGYTEAWNKYLSNKGLSYPWSQKWDSTGECYLRCPNPPSWLLSPRASASLPSPPPQAHVQGLPEG